MFHDCVRRRTTKQIFFLFLLIVIGIGMASSVSADSGPLFNDGALIGKIVDENGNGIDSVSVHLIGVNGTATPFGNQSSESDGDGNYTFSEVPRGSYMLRVTDYLDRYAGQFVGGGIQSNSATIFEIWNNTPVEANMTLQASGYIEGKVTTPLQTSNFTPSVSVSYYDEGFGRWIVLDTDYVERNDNGRFRLSHLPTGSYRVSAYDYINGRDYTVYFDGARTPEDATPVVVTSGQTTGNIDLSLGDPANEVPSIKGRVVSDRNGVPLANIEVDLYRHFEGNSDWSRLYVTVETDANGEYAFTNLEPANYKVGFGSQYDSWAHEFNGNKPTLGGAPELSVKEGETLVVDAELTPGSTVSMRLDAQGIEHIPFHMVAYRWNEHDAWLETAYDYNDFNGQFMVIGLPAGTYVFKISGVYANNQRFDLFYGNTSNAADATQVVVEAATSYNLEPVQLQAEVGRIEGRVTDSTGQPVSTAQIWVLSVPTNGGPAQYVGLASSDASGSFRTEHLVPGNYKLWARSSVGDVVPTYNGDVFEENEAPVISVGVNGSVKTDIQMRSGGSIQGNVTIAADFVPNYAYAEAWRLVDGEWIQAGSSSIEANGSYVLTKLMPGEYKIYLQAGRYAPYPNRPFEYGEWVDDSVTRDGAISFIVEEASSQAAPDQQLGNIVASQSRSDGSISGEILSAAWRPGDGFEARAYLKTFPPRGSAYWVLQTSVPVDENGNYALDGLVHGTYVIGFYDTTNEHKPEYYNNVADIESATELVISAETPSIDGINAILQLSTTRIR